MTAEEKERVRKVAREELVQWLVEWCAEHGQVESAFLYPDPAHYVFTFSLFDDLAEKLGVEKEVLGKRFNAAQERQAAVRVCPSCGGAGHYFVNDPPGSFVAKDKKCEECGGSGKAKPR